MGNPLESKPLLPVWGGDSEFGNLPELSPKQQKELAKTIALMEDIRTGKAKPGTVVMPDSFFEK